MRNARRCSGQFTKFLNKLKDMIKILLGFLAAFCILPSESIYCQAGQHDVKVQVDFQSKIGSMTPIWAWFGYDEPNYTYMKDGKKLLSEIAAMSPVPVFVRTHSMLVTGDGTAALKWGSTNAYTEDLNGNAVYNWKITDSIFDTYIQRGMKPLAQIGFMPEALSIKPQPYRHYWEPGRPYSEIVTGWAYPPKDYHKWAELVFQWVKHCVERYGKREVESWYWELWNEPDSPYYWNGTQEEFFKLYDYTADAVKRALPSAKIGGTDATGGRLHFQEAFIKHCLYGTNYATGQKGAPLDVVLFHAKGSPELKDEGVVMGIRSQLQNIRDHFKLISDYPQLKKIPVIIGESDPEGCAACGMKTDPQNAYRNGTMYSSYTAASFARKYELMRLWSVNLIGAVSWSFEFENQPWFYGFRDLATNGVDKPVLNVFRMFGKMGGDLVRVEAERMYKLDAILESGIRGNQTDIGALASISKKSGAVMVWNYHDADLMGDAEKVAVELKNVPARNAVLSVFLIDQKNSNSYEVWKKMGSPQSPSPDQIDALEQAGQLNQVLKKKIKISGGSAVVDLELKRQAVALVKLDW